MNREGHCEVVERFIEERKLVGAFADTLRQLPVPLRKVMADLINAINPSGNTLRELYRIGKEIAHRDRVPLQDTLLHQELQSILVAKNLSFKEKQHKVKEWLIDRRYPALGEIKRALSAHLNVLRRDTGIAFELPKDLEGDSISFTLSARSSLELVQLAEQITKASQHRSLEEIYRVLKGEISSDLV